MAAGFQRHGGADRENGVNGRPPNPRPFHPPADAQRAGQLVRGYPGRVGFASDPRSASAPRRREPSRGDPAERTQRDEERHETATSGELGLRSALTPGLPLVHWKLARARPVGFGHESLGPLSADCVKAIRPFAPEHFAATPAREQRSQSRKPTRASTTTTAGRRAKPRGCCRTLRAPDRACATEEYEAARPPRLRGRRRVRVRERDGGNLSPAVPPSP
jgi:hypothetical protein